MTVCLRITVHLLPVQKSYPMTACLMTTVRPIAQPEVLPNDRGSDDCKLGSSADNDGLLSPTQQVGTQYSLLDCDIVQIDRETDQSRKPNRQQQMPVPHSRTLETERHTYQIPSKLRPRVMVVTDQNGARPPDNVNCNWLEVLSHADLQQLGPTRERCYCG